ncbi:OLC1v1023204C1 [Oldenlandia corymbosa var. corymbosa]|uniref:OLC1v1023204C1 n=1 Tax=Oldenlandia corymbosa var. corymbosa TaxID=529605 RepID=A0AAV1BZF9_OLDCO|nr:OLC1v1023204C1 [Oldenlandia corymbosa var. corymbosa]
MMSPDKPRKLSTCHAHKESNLLIPLQKKTFLAPNCGYVVEFFGVKPHNTPLITAAFSRNKVSSLVTSGSLCVEPDHFTKLYANIGSKEVLHVVDSGLKGDSHFLEERSIVEDTQTNNSSDLPKSSNLKNERETERRRKIGIANKGKVPWNKGRKHSEETRKTISQRTKEAMRDPKVRKKISECSRSLSNETKAKISMSHRKLWEERLKWRRSREKIFQLWAENIARAAKVGHSDQEELEWDSFENIKREIHIEQLEQAALRAKEKEAARIRAEKAAKAREAKRNGLTEKKKNRGKKAKVVGELKRKAGKRSEEDEEELASNQELKLRRNLMKIRKQKSRLSHIDNQNRRSWEKLDVKLERMEQNHNLADQIRVAKCRRAELITQESLKYTSSNQRQENLNELNYEVQTRNKMVSVRSNPCRQGKSPNL